MSWLDKIYEQPCYGVEQIEKSAMMLEVLNRLDEHHYANCKAYQDILRAYNRNPGTAMSIADLTFLPVRLFKEMELKSIPNNKVFKTLNSSGTTGQVPSRIFLDGDTAKHQTKTLVKIMQTFLGKKRLPMLIIDHQSVVKDRRSFSARGAGILGLYNFGRKHTYALSNENMDIDLDVIKTFTKLHPGEPILIFGFTFMIWKYFITELEAREESIDLSQATLIHSGGWKKLQDEAVDNQTFKDRLKAVTGIKKVHNFYGMVEQVGSIFVECEFGHLHAPIFSDIIIRDAITWAEKPIGEQGIIQVVSTLPKSYPGHSLLTEDLGTILGEDDCPCGRKGRYFNVSGRLPKSEVRGCSDTHTQAAA